MIKISQQEFEEKVQDIIDGKTTRTQLQIDLRTDKNTLNNKIQELVVYNPELYRAFVQKFPYRPREYSHIDYEALIIDIMKKGYTRREWDEVYGISSRTIIRKIYCIEDENPAFESERVERGMQYRINTRVDEVVFGIAWATDYEGTDDVRVWFAADPTVYFKM